MAKAEEPKGSGGVTRRDLFKRGAIAGGVLWAVPAIQTIAAPAAQAASAPTGACCECKKPVPPLFLTCAVDDPSCDSCTIVICGGASNFSRYFVGTGCGCTANAPKKCIPGTACVQQACPQR